jgi:hypothetical protein
VAVLASVPMAGHSTLVRVLEQPIPQSRKEGHRAGAEPAFKPFGLVAECEIRPNGGH